jgi:hypothetical protein
MRPAGDESVCALLELSTSIALYLSLISHCRCNAHSDKAKTPPIDDSFHQEKYFVEFGNNG